MTDSTANTVIPYARFLEHQQRRRVIAAELTHRDRVTTVDADPSHEASADADASVGVIGPTPAGMVGTSGISRDE